MSLFYDTLILIVGYLIVNFSYNFLLRLLNVNFKDYLLKTNGYLNLKIISYLIIMYLFYKFNIIDFDSLFKKDNKLNILFNTPILTKIIYSFIVFFICKTIIFLITSFNNFQKDSFDKPNTLINNYLKVMNFFIIISGFILFVSIWMEVNVLTLIAGLSTASAVFALIFRDFILGVITSITSANTNIARIGDYIKLPKYNIEGTILDISITNVKLKLEDYSVVSFPSYWLLNDIMKNNWLIKETHIKQLNLAFYLNLENINKIELYKLENIINCFNVCTTEHILFKFNNSDYNNTSLNISFFLNYTNEKEFEEIKFNIYNDITKYLLNIPYLLLKYNHF